MLFVSLLSDLIACLENKRTNKKLVDNLQMVTSFSNTFGVGLIPFPTGMKEILLLHLTEASSDWCWLESHTIMLQTPWTFEIVNLDMFWITWYNLGLHCRNHFSLRVSGRSTQHLFGQRSCLHFVKLFIFTFLFLTSFLFTRLLTYRTIY